MTEDIEFTAKCVLSGEKVAWVPDAVIYDEQPLTFGQSWKQRKRWSTGIIQSFEVYGSSLLKGVFYEKNMSCFDLFMAMTAPFMQLVYFASVIFTILLNSLYLKYSYFPQTHIFYKLFLAVDSSYLISFVIALVIILLERKSVVKMLKGIFTYWLFLISWMPISIICIFKKQTDWVQIKHTRVIKLKELVSENN
jgi:cellulose synthase/poly-beta-1,6-N-acetylglucosamine synthase-like glycosyltransferase